MRRMRGPSCQVQNLIKEYTLHCTRRNTNKSMYKISGWVICFARVLGGGIGWFSLLFSLLFCRGAFVYYVCILLHPFFGLLIYALNLPIKKKSCHLTTKLTYELRKTPSTGARTVAAYLCLYSPFAPYLCNCWLFTSWSFILVQPCLYICCIGNFFIIALSI